ncbi:MAG: hypothetical protein CL878_05130 [Dehalococcoidia bacterium]|nr:hypothetical protein [Dehalococcoidia bacterium]
MTTSQARPLQGRRVLVTRPRAQAPVLATVLAEHGAEPVVLPLIAPTPVTDTSKLDAGIVRLARGGYRWLIFSSANGARFFLTRVQTLGYDERICQQARVVAGAATATTLAQQGVRADVTLTNFRAETVSAQLATASLTDQQVLLPRAAGGRPVLPHTLRQRGAVVDEVVVYRSAPVPESSAPLARWLRSGTLNAITFTSSSTVRHFMAALATEALTDWQQEAVVIACIGATTAATAQEHGLRVDAIPEQTTAAALVQALAAVFARRRSASAAAADGAPPRMLVTQEP